MKTPPPLLHLISIIGLIALMTGCSSTQNLSGSKLPKKELATLRITSGDSSGRVTTQTTIESIDGKAVSSENTYVTVEPGRHIIGVGFYKEIAPSGLNFSIGVNLFGNESTVKEARPSQTISSKQPTMMTVTLRAGKRYTITSTDNLRPASDEGLSEIERSIQKMTGGFSVQGSWTPHINESK